MERVFLATLSAIILDRLIGDEKFDASIPMLEETDKSWAPIPQPDVRLSRCHGRTSHRYVLNTFAHAILHFFAADGLSFKWLFAAGRRNVEWSAKRLGPRCGHSSASCL